MYMTGYSGKVRTLAELQAWSEWQNLDPEYQRRALAIMDASIHAGRPLGIGSIFRTFARQESLFLSRHHIVSSGGCCTYQGKRWALNAGVAHAAPPGRSYHEATTRAGKALAIDFIGDLNFLAQYCAAYGLLQFKDVNGEPWHSQPSELPKGRAQYVQATMDPLKTWPLPGYPPPPAATKVYAPVPTLRQGASNDPTQVRAFQMHCNFWGWRDALGRTLVVDGDYGSRSAQACISMQQAFKITADGIYGPQSQRTLQAFLDMMAQAR